MNYAIVKNMFGIYWIGKTELPLKGESIFATYEEALIRAIDLCEYDDDEANIEELEEEWEVDVEKIEKEVEQWII